MLPVQMMLELEAEQGTSDEPGSLMDRVLVGMITSYSRCDCQNAEILGLTLLIRRESRRHP